MEPVIVAAFVAALQKLNNEQQKNNESTWKVIVLLANTNAIYKTK